MRKTFGGPGEALEFLVEEGATADALEEQQANVISLASDTLKNKGAYVASIRGLYGGTAGLIGSSRPGERLIQGTEPIAVSGLFLALRHGITEKDYSVYLVSTPDQTGNYLPQPPFPPDIISEMAGKLKLRGVPQPEIRLRHIEAVNWLVEAIAEGVEPLASGIKPLDALPKIENPYGEYALNDRQVINLRTQRPRRPI